MNVTASNVPLNLEAVAASLMVNEDHIEEESVAPPAKKQRFGVEMNRVAEIVLVLSALGRMRGGEYPTKSELELMVETRSKLVEIYQQFSPKDIIPRDDIRALIQDLGFNQKNLLIDENSPPKLTISEKLSLGKRKMEEEEKKFSKRRVLTTGYDRVQPPVLAKNVSVSHQWPCGGVASVNTNGSHFRMERPQMVVNGASQGTPNSYARSAQPQSTISFSNAPNKEVAVQSSIRVTDPVYRPFSSKTQNATFTAANKPMQGTYYGQASSFGNNHADIAKIVHKVLHPQAKQYPLWNPPSRDYMSSATTCQMCEVTINEVETLLICDQCKIAYHLKCLQANNMNAVPKSEWYCSGCVQEFKSTPFPPQYGHAIRIAKEKVPASSTAGVQLSTGKKVGSINIKVNQQKPIVTTSPGVQNVPGFASGAATTSHFETASLNANTTASATDTTNIGPQGYRESVICGTDSPPLASITETPNPAALASTSVVRNNGTVSSTCPRGNQVPVKATSIATPRTPTVTENGDNRSTCSGTAADFILNTDITTQVHAITVTSSSNSQLLVSHSDTSKASEDAAIGQALNADDEPQAPMENVVRCENPPESASHSDPLNDKTTSGNGQDSSKGATEKVVSETCQNHPTKSPAPVISDQDSKITAEPSMPQGNSAYQTEKTVSQPSSVSSNYHSKTEKETPNVQVFSQNALGDLQEGKGFYGLDGHDRRKKQPSKPKVLNIQI